MPLRMGRESDVFRRQACFNVPMSSSKGNVQALDLEQYREFFENAVIGMFRTTPDGRFLAANQALAEILGYQSPEELMTEVTDIGSQIFVDRQQRVDVIERAHGQKSVQATESLRRRRDGSTFWASIRWRVSLDDGGSPVYFEGTMEDITERKKREADVPGATQSQGSPSASSPETARAARLESTLQRIASELALIGMDGSFQVERLAPSELEGFKSLTRRETEVLRAIVTGDRVQTIAKTLNLAANTVRNHLKSIFIKLGVRSQVELVEKLKKRP